MSEQGKSDRSEYRGSLRSPPESGDSARDYWSFRDEQMSLRRRFAKGSDLAEDNAEPAKQDGPVTGGVSHNVNGGGLSENVGPGLSDRLKTL